MSLILSSDGYRSSLDLAILHKAEKKIREIMNQPSDTYFMRELYINEASDVITYEYMRRLFTFIDLDPFLNDGFAGFYHKVMEETHEFDEDALPIYTFNFGLLSDAMKQYGVYPFKKILEEVDILMNSLSAMRILSFYEYIDFMYQYSYVRDERYCEAESFEHEMSVTYLCHLDFTVYSLEEIIDMMKQLPVFVMKYIQLYKKMIHFIQQLGGVEKHVVHGTSPKRIA